MDAGTIIGIAGGLVGLVMTVITVGRWAGAREAADDALPKEQRDARDETRAAVKRIEESVVSLEHETKQGFERIGERMRPLLDRHAQQQIVDRDLAAVTAESKENRERIIKMETQLGDLRSKRQPRARKTGGS